MGEDLSKGREVGGAGVLAENFFFIFRFLLLAFFLIYTYLRGRQGLKYGRPFTSPKQRRECTRRIHLWDQS